MECDGSDWGWSYGVKVADLRRKSRRCSDCEAAMQRRDLARLGEVVCYAIERWQRCRDDRTARRAMGVKMTLKCAIHWIVKIAKDKVCKDQEVMVAIWCDNSKRSVHYQ